MSRLCLVTADNDKIISHLSSIDSIDLTIVTNLTNQEELDEYFNNNKFDLIAISKYYGELPSSTDCPIIKIHPSLLPSFPNQTAIKDAYMAGVKVTGVTIYYPEDKRIIAQYPIILDNYTHYDQLVSEVEELSAKLFPIVIKSILEDKVFDIVDYLMDTNSHCGSCSNCGKCY